MARFPADQPPIDAALVRRLPAEQFPLSADLRPSRVEPAGTAHAVFRLGADVAPRLPRREGPTETGGTVHDMRPRLGRARTFGTTVTSTCATGSYGAGASAPSSIGVRWASATRPAM